MANGRRAVEQEASAAVRAATTMVAQVHGQSAAAEPSATQQEESPIVQEVMQEDPYMQLRELDATLAAMHGDSVMMQTLRAQMNEEKERLKRTIIESKPLHVRVESCRAATARASRRAAVATEARETAERALREAQAAEQQALNEATQRQTELEGLERVVVQQAQAVMSAQSSQHGNVLEQLEGAMSAVGSDMTRSALGADVVREVTQMMETLISGLHRLAGTRPGEVAAQRALPSVRDMLMNPAASSRTAPAAGFQQASPHMQPPEGQPEADQAMASPARTDNGAEL